MASLSEAIPKSAKHQIQRLECPDKNVFRLEISVDDLARVDVLDGAKEVAHDA